MYFLDSHREIKIWILVLHDTDSYLLLAKKGKYNMEQCIEMVENVLSSFESYTSIGLLPSHDVRKFKIVSELLQPFLLTQTDAKEYICGGGSMETYNWIYNLLLITLYLVCIETLHSTEVYTANAYVLLELLVKEEELYIRLYPTIRQYIQKKGIRIIKFTYIGSDIESTKQDTEHNRLISAQLAVTTKTFVKIPGIRGYTISKIDESTNKLKALSNSSTILNYTKRETSLNLCIDKIRTLKYAQQEVSWYKFPEGMNRIKGWSYTEQAELTWLLDSYIFTRSIALTDDKGMIKYTRLLNSYNVTSHFYVHVQIQKYSKDTRSLYFDNLTRSIALYIPKWIIKFDSTSYKQRDIETKAILENYANGNTKNNIKITTTAPTLLSAPLQCLPQRGWDLSWLRWMADRYSATLLRIRCAFVEILGEGVRKNIITILIFIFFILGSYFVVFFPHIFEYFTKIDLFNTTITNYPITVFVVKKAYKIVWRSWFVLFFVFFKWRFNFNLSISRLKKPLIAVAPIIITGGFEGLGDPEVFEQPTKPRVSLLELMSGKAKISELGWQSKETSDSLPRLNQDVHTVSPPDAQRDIDRLAEGSQVAESSKANHAKPTTKCNSNYGYPFWPRTNPALNLSNLPESNSELGTTNEEDNNKKIRIKGYTEVKRIPSSGRLEENSDDVIKYEYETPKNWNRKYPKVEEENRPEIEIVHPKLEVENLKYKSSRLLPLPNIENHEGKINNPASTLKRGVINHLKDKFK